MDLVRIVCNARALIPANFFGNNRERRDWDTKQQLIIADGLIFGLTKAGELVMAEANKAGYKELGRVAHGLEIHHTQQPTLANGRLYIRGLDTVVCYQLTEALLDNRRRVNPRPEQSR